MNLNKILSEIYVNLIILDYKITPLFLLKNITVYLRYDIIFNINKILINFKKIIKNLGL